MSTESRRRGEADAHARAGREPANGGRSSGSAAAREEEGADGWGLPVSVPQREGEGGSDERDPPVSDRVRGRARALRPRGGQGRAGLRAEFLGHSRQHCCFSFSVYAKFDVCLKLSRKSCTDSKIIGFFRQVL